MDTKAPRSKVFPRSDSLLDEFESRSRGSFTDVTASEAPSPLPRRKEFMVAEPLLEAIQQGKSRMASGDFRVRMPSASPPKMPDAVKLAKSALTQLKDRARGAVKKVRGLRVWGELGS